MTWQEKLIKKAEKVMAAGWGYVKLTVTENGKRRNYEHYETEHEEDKGAMPMKR